MEIKIDTIASASSIKNSNFNIFDLYIFVLVFLKLLLVEKNIQRVKNKWAKQAIRNN